MPEEEVQDRLKRTVPQLPIANVYIPGMVVMNDGSYMSNHIVMGYGDVLAEFIATCVF
jgi:hypothetical protein